MARFRFKLETVLKHREMVEDQCQREMAMKLRQRMILLNQLRQMQETIVQSKHDLSGALRGAVDMGQIAQFSRFSGQVAQRAQALVLHFAGTEKQIEAARAKLLEAAKARKALELLRTRQHEAWQQEQQRRETALLDDLATQRYLRDQAVEANA